MVALNLFKNSIEDFEKALKVLDDNDFSGDVLDVIKSGIIQKYEICYELAWTTMRRFIIEYGDSKKAENMMSKKDIFRLAAQHGYIDNPEDWFDYTNARNTTSHVYNEVLSDYVFDISKRFLKDVKKLYHTLELNND